MTEPAILPAEPSVNDKQWAVPRHTGIGGSEAAAVIGVSPWTTPLDLYLRKVGLAPEFETTEVMEWGNRLEPIVLQKFREASGYIVIPGDEANYQHRHPVDDFMIAHVDGLYERPDGQCGVLEVKTTSAYGKADWEEDVPVHYAIQGQHYAHVVDVDWIAFAVLIGGNHFRWIEVKRNDRFTKALVKAERDFWERVVTEEPPPATGKDSKALSVLFPHEDSDPEPVVMPPEASYWDDQRKQAIADIKDAEERKAAAEAWIKEFLGTAAYGALPGGGRYSWKTVNVEAHTRPARSYRVLRRLK